MLIQNYCFTDPAEIISCIKRAECGYDTQIKNAASALTSNPALMFIALSGPTCSGKTTTAKRLTEELSALGHVVHTVSIDDFFRSGNETERGNLDHDVETDYESAGALDLDYFAECVRGITEKRRVYLPSFNFRSGRRSGYTLFEPCEESIVIFEGLQAVYPEVLSLLPADKCGRIHVSVDDDIRVHGSVFTRREIRLIRRIVRDFKFRGASPEFTLYLWGGVIKNEDKNITPYVGGISVRVNTLLEYEINMIKNDFIDILKCVKPGSRYYAECAGLISRFDMIPAVDKAYLPANSVFREFIGF
jgi:uridine kinase